VRSLLALLLARAVLAATHAPILLVPLEGDRKDVRAVEKNVVQEMKKAGRDAKVSARTMGQLQDAAGCSEDSPACLSLVGKAAGTDEFVFGSVFRDGRQLKVLLRRFSVTTGREEGRSEAVMKRASGRAIRPAIADLMRAAGAAGPAAEPGAPTAPAPLGTLEVQSALPGVLIRLNGQPRGTAPLRLEEIGVAVYDLEAEKAGYRTWRGQASVEAGRVTTIQVALDPLPAELRTTSAAAAPPSLGARTWVAGGLTAALLGAAAAFAIATVSAQSDFDNDVSHVDPSAPDAAQQLNAINERTDTGERKALLANVLFGAAGAAAVVTGVFVYLDLHDRPATTPSVRIEPTGIAVRF
jgi:PEGA domain-containing protein